MKGASNEKQIWETAVRTEQWTDPDGKHDWARDWDGDLRAGAPGCGEGEEGKQTLLNIINHNYNAELRYLEICIDNDRHGFDLIISMNEYVLYNCLITGFIEALEHEEINNKDKEQDTWI